LSALLKRITHFSRPDYMAFLVDVFHLIHRIAVVSFFWYHRYTHCLRGWYRCATFFCIISPFSTTIKRLSVWALGFSQGFNTHKDKTFTRKAAKDIASVCVCVCVCARMHALTLFASGHSWPWWSYAIVIDYVKWPLELPRQLPCRLLSKSIYNSIVAGVNCVQRSLNTSFAYRYDWPCHSAIGQNGAASVQKCTWLLTPPKPFTLLGQ